jgi:hypothetical protein
LAASTSDKVAGSGAPPARSIWPGADGPADVLFVRKGIETDPLRQPETFDFVRAYFEIDDPMVRRRLLDLARALAMESDAIAEIPPALTRIYRSRQKRPPPEP